MDVEDVLRYRQVHVQCSMFMFRDVQDACGGLGPGRIHLDFLPSGTYVYVGIWEIYLGVSVRDKFILSIIIRILWYQI